MAILATIGTLSVSQSGLRDRLDLVSRQVTTGQKATRQGDLGTEARAALDLRGEIARRETYAQATEIARGRMAVAQTTLGRLSDIGAELSAEALRARTLGSTGVEALAKLAGSALEEVAALLNLRHDGEYVFAGSDLLNAPLPDAAGIATGPMATAIATAVAGLTPTNAAAVLADTATAATAPATTPFSAFQEGPATTEPRRAVPADDGQRIAWGVRAATDQAGEVALSWGRELMRHLATLAALTPASALQEAGYDALLDGVQQGLSGAAGGLSAEEAVLGAAEKRAEAAGERHRDLVVALKARLGRVEEVDVAAAATELRTLETRLQASYQATSILAGLSLANFLR
jgi:flagellin-like hook-associated protein FlgL